MHIQDKPRPSELDNGGFLSINIKPLWLPVALDDQQAATPKYGNTKK